MRRQNRVPVVDSYSTGVVERQKVVPRSRGLDRSRWLQTCPNQEERNSNDKSKSGRGGGGREER